MAEQTNIDLASAMQRMTECMNGMKDMLHSLQSSSHTSQQSSSNNRQVSTSPYVLNSNYLQHSTPIYTQTHSQRLENSSKESVQLHMSNLFKKKKENVLTKPGVTAASAVSKEVVLLPRRLINSVPKPQQICKWSAKELVITGFGFVKGWSEAEVVGRLKDAFADKLNGREILILFADRKNEFLFQPRLYNQTLNGETVLQQAGKNSVFLKPDRDLSDEDSSDDDVVTIDVPQRSSCRKRRSVTAGQESSNYNDSRKKKNTSAFHDDHTYFKKTDVAHDDDSLLEFIFSDCTPDLKLLVEELENQALINQAVKKNLVVRRQNAFYKLEEWVKEECFNPWQRLQVVFIGEQGVDTSGLLRDLLSEWLTYIHESKMFWGPLNKKFIQFNLLALKRRHYYVAGVAVILSMIHNGPSPKIFCDAMVEMMFGEKYPLLDIENVDDEGLKEALQLLRGSTTVEEVHQLLTTNPTLNRYGFQDDILYLDTVELIIQEILTYHCKTRLQEPINQFVEGLNAGGLFKAMLRDPQHYKQYFSQRHPHTVEELSDLFTVDSFLWTSAPEPTMTHWNRLLKDLAGQKEICRPGHLLRFTTGSHEIPALGYEKKIALEFLTDLTRTLPLAAACGLQLSLPTCHNTYDRFKHFMFKAFLETNTFERS